MTGINMIRKNKMIRNDKILLEMINEDQENVGKYDKS